ncbi:MAG: hypothetical protein IJF17_13250 [Thermoguttaceae bacterium]|nr:hypothetical protein [Thermoguttaceae bacterium]MDO4425428.1 hypothetical protein [Planctomycetia bacterium]
MIDRLFRKAQLEWKQRIDPRKLLTLGKKNQKRTTWNPRIGTLPAKQTAAREELAVSEVWA